MKIYICVHYKTDHMNFFYTFNSEGSSIIKIPSEDNRLLIAVKTLSKLLICVKVLAEYIKLTVPNFFLIFFESLIFQYLS